MTKPLDKWTAIKMGCTMFVTDADLDWLTANLTEPDATHFAMDVATIPHVGVIETGYQAKLGSFSDGDDS